MLNAPYYMQDFIKGALLVGALAFTFSIGRQGGGELVFGVEELLIRNAVVLG